MSDAQPLSLIRINCKNLFNKIQFIEPLDFLRAKNSIISFVNLAKKPVYATALKKFMLLKNFQKTTLTPSLAGGLCGDQNKSISFVNLVKKPVRATALSKLMLSKILQKTTLTPFLASGLCGDQKSIVSFVNFVKKPVHATAFKKFMFSKNIVKNYIKSCFCGWSL